MKWTVISVYPSDGSGKIEGNAEVLFQDVDYLKGEDWNREKKRAYQNLEIQGAASVKVRVAVMLDSNGQPMCLGPVRPDMGTDREVAAAVLELIQERRAVKVEKPAKAAATAAK